MSITVQIPTPLLKLTGNRSEVTAGGADVKGLIEDLEENFPGIKERICDKNGQVRRFVNIYVNDEDIRFLRRDDTPLEDGDRVSIIPAIAGG